MWLKMISKKKIILKDNVIKSTETVQEELRENLNVDLTEKEQSQRLNSILSLIAVTLLVNATVLAIIASVYGNITCPCKDINSFQKHMKGKFLIEKMKHILLHMYSSENINVL